MCVCVIIYVSYTYTYISGWWFETCFLLCWYSNVINHPFFMVYITHKNGDEWGMVYYCYTNIIGNVIIPSD